MNKIDKHSHAGFLMSYEDALVMKGSLLNIARRHNNDQCFYGNGGHYEWEYKIARRLGGIIRRQLNQKGIATLRLTKSFARYGYHNHKVNTNWFEYFYACLANSDRYSRHRHLEIEELVIPHPNGYTMHIFVDPKHANPNGVLLCLTRLIKIYGEIKP